LKRKTKSRSKLIQRGEIKKKNSIRAGVQTNTSQVRTGKPESDAGPRQTRVGQESMPQRAEERRSLGSNSQMIHKSKRGLGRKGELEE